MSFKLKGLSNVQRAMDNIIESRNVAVRSVFIDVLGEVVKLTPVDEGTAKNNWHLGSAGSIRGGNTGGSGSLADIQKMPPFVLDKTVKLINPLPYIMRLEYGGHSQQKPSGWVRSVLLNGAKKVKEI